MPGLAGMDYTLDYIEHKILRPMGDARVHFAINCASVSCPDLRTESYRSGKLGSQLNEQTILTFDNPNKGLHTENGTLYVSRVFDWFAADFNDGDVKGWLRPYVPADENAPLRYLDYDWSLNKTR